MSSTTTPPTAEADAPDRPVSVLAWRDYDIDACRLPGMDLGELAIGGRSAEEVTRLWELGARRVRLPKTVDLAVAAADPVAAARAVRALCLVRDLTARAVLVEWRLTLADADPDGWRALNHLQPPQDLAGPTGATEALAEWRHRHYLCKCLWRQGPGFVQIRDRRWGDLRRFTVAEPEYQEAIALLEDGVPARRVDPEILADLRSERLVGEVGELVWWLPYRVRRWIQEAMTV
ncbi:DUF5825 family protein [Streptomyces sp. SAJ15]|uniref:DUF5825 family protein n=1 Tax=Streptomyces sp. SAJ15 TaxID=2011095 RepID=UPI001184D26C|nr:DUF5825 family protein [Streptomyces sp. SAJ15]TVL89355.1 hypothetical protein CD790_28165 [Streptomyces sp. SAJ15]